MLSYGRREAGRDQVTEVVLRSHTPFPGAADWRAVQRTRARGRVVTKAPMQSLSWQTGRLR